MVLPILATIGSFLGGGAAATGVGAALGSVAKATLPTLAKGLIAKKLAPDQSSSRTNFVQLAADARAAGFNPLTALRATGGAGNVTTTAPALSSQAFIGEALGRGVDTLFNRKELARDQERSELEAGIMREQLKQLQIANSSQIAQQSFGFATPGVTTDASHRAVKPALAAGAVDHYAPNLYEQDPSRNTSTSYGTAIADRRWSPTEDIETEYGDVLSWGYGAAKSLHDLGLNLGMKIGSVRLKRAIKRGYEANRAKKPQFSQKNGMRSHYGTFNGGRSPGF